MYSPLLIVLTEVVMTPLIVWIIDYTRKNMGQLGFRPYAISIVILVMMGSMLDAFFYYIVSPKDFFDTVLSATIGMVLMTAALVYIFWIAVNAKKSYTSPMSVIGISGLITWNEVSMALLLFSLTGVHVSARGGLLYVAYFGRSVTYYLFLAPMLVEMLYFLAFRLSPGFQRRFSLSVFLMQVADPPALAGPGKFVTIMLAAYAVLMVVSIYLLLSFVYKNRNSLTSGERQFMSLFFAIFALSAIGIVEPVVVSHPPFGLSWAALAVA